MEINEEEKEKVESKDIKKLENTLNLINNEEKNLLLEFDKDIIKILGSSFVPVLEFYKDNPPKKDVSLFSYNKNVISIPKNFLLKFHLSYIKNPDEREKVVESLKKWFAKKTLVLESVITSNDTYDVLNNNIPHAFALASLALTAFHRKSNMRLRDVQKLAAIAMAEGNIAELSTGEGKTLSAVLPIYLFALRKKGSHLVTSNSYLAGRDYEETKPIYEGLGLKVGYLPEDIIDIAKIYGYDSNNLDQYAKYDLQQKLFKLKRDAYNQDITYGSNSTFAFDYLRDCNVRNPEEMIQKIEKPGFALIDEIDDALIDDALTPYKIAGNPKIYSDKMSIFDLSNMYEVDYDELVLKCKNYGIEEKELSYDEARYIVNSIIVDELLPDENLFLEIASNFFKTQKTKEIDNETFDKIEDSWLYDSSQFQKEYPILYSRGLKKHKITDNCIDNFLKYSYLALKINSIVKMIEHDLLKDSNYIKGLDYYVDDKHLKVTLNGADKLLNDKNYPIINNDYQKFISFLSLESSIMLHYLNQVVIANLLMTKDEDYTLHMDAIKPVKNGRIEEGSNFSYGLHQALELKEGLLRDKRTKETSTFSSITQKDFYKRYDIYSGMTGTSSKEIFRDVYNIKTTVIPKNSFYEYLRKNKGPEPANIIRKDVKFTLENIHKYSLILDSIKESVKKDQPVLLVLSDITELNGLENLLKSYKFNYQTLNLNDDKEEEALKLSQAGLPGMVTISTAMAGRGTDIKLGGDRDTLIEILKGRHIRSLEEKYQERIEIDLKTQEKIRQNVEDAYFQSGYLWTKQEEIDNQLKLEKNGLKVISSGYFKVNRIDRQLEGRTGRNGFGGVTERYASLKDIQLLGLDIEEINDNFIKAEKRKDLSLKLDSDYEKKLLKKIMQKQKQNEDNIKSNIVYTQNVNSYAVKMIEEYRLKRKNILSNNSDEKIDEVIDTTINSIFANNFSKDDIVNLNNKILDSKSINLSNLLLEIKEILGVNINEKELEENSLSTLKDIISKESLKKINSSEKTKNILLDKNDYIIANIPYIVDLTQLHKSTMTISGGFNGIIDPMTAINFYNNKELLNITSSVNSLKKHLGAPISKKEYQERIKEDIIHEEVYENDFLSKYRLLKGKKENNLRLNSPKLNIRGYVKLIKENIYKGFKIRNVDNNSKKV